MATFLFANNAATTLAGPISNTATTCNVAAGSGVLFPQPGTGQFFAMTFLDATTRTIREIVYVTAVSGDTLTITRAQENTAAGTWNAGDIAANLVTAGTLNSFAQSANLASSFFQGTDNGSDPNNIVVPSTVPTNNGPTPGQIFVITKGPQANTGAVTLRIPSAGTQSSLVYADGTALASGDWPGNAGMIVRLTSGGPYQVLTRIIQTPPAPVSRLYFGTPTGGSATALTTTLTPTVSALVAGLRVTVPITTTSGAAATLTVPVGVGATPTTAPIVVNRDGTALVGNEMPGGVNYDADLEFDSGGKWRLLNPVLVQPGTSESTLSTTGTTAMTNANSQGSQVTNIPVTGSLYPWATLSNGVITIQQSGTYSINGTGQFGSTSTTNTTTYYYIWVYKNGAVVAPSFNGGTQGTLANTGTVFSQNVNYLFPLVVGDTVELRGAVAVGSGSLAASSIQALSYLHFVKVA